MTSFRRFAILAGFATAVFAVSAGSASAWYCEAHSRNAWGWGSSTKLSSAKRIALRQCAVRTPRGRYCRITSCR